VHLGRMTSSRALLAEVVERRALGMAVAAAERARAKRTSRRSAARSAAAAAAAKAVCPNATPAPEAATGTLPCAGIDPAYVEIVKGQTRSDL
jgi:hypothetical protein